MKNALFRSDTYMILILSVIELRGTEETHLM